MKKLYRRFLVWLGFKPKHVVIAEKWHRSTLTNFTRGLSEASHQPFTSEPIVYDFNPTPAVTLIDIFLDTSDSSSSSDSSSFDFGGGDSGGGGASGDW